MGLAVPGDLSVIGGDNKTESLPDGPELTTLEQDTATMGRIAMEKLQQRIRDPKRMVARINCKPELVVRGSTGRPGEPLKAVESKQG